MKKAREKAHAILNAVSKTDAHCEEIRAYNFARAKASFYNVQDTETIMNRILDKTYRIWELENLKRVAEETIQTAPQETKAVMQLRFIEGKPLLEIAEIFGISERSVSRMIARAVDWFTAHLIDLDYYYRLLTK